MDTHRSSPMGQGSLLDAPGSYLPESSANRGSNGLSTQLSALTTRFSRCFSSVTADPLSVDRPASPNRVTDGSDPSLSTASTHSPNSTHRARDYHASRYENEMRPLPISFYNPDGTVTPTPDATATRLRYSPIYGYGLVDAGAAVARLIGQDRFRDVADLGGNNWGNDVVRAPEVWAQGFTGQGVTVAVLDTGVDYTHFDLDSNIWTNAGEIAGNGIDDDRNGFVDDIRGWDFINNDNDPMDDDKHGTHVAGTIAAENNGLGITGVAYNAKIMPVKVLAPDGGPHSAIAQGIRYAVDNGADVINMSLGGSYSEIVIDAIRYANRKGVAVIMASGNESQPQPGYPAAFATDVGIAVGAVDHTRMMGDFSNLAGNNPAMRYVVAPGVQTVSTIPGGGYEPLNGTSMAAPHVAGVAALMLSANSRLTPEQLRQIVIETAQNRDIRPFTPSPNVRRFGYSSVESVSPMQPNVTIDWN